MFEDIPDINALAARLELPKRTLWWLITSMDYRLWKHSKMYQTFTIAKSGGRKRVIHEPCGPLKHVQGRLLYHFFNEGEYGEQVGAYVLGRGLNHTRARHTGGAVLISADIHNFFGSVTRRHFRRWLEAHGASKRLSSALPSLVMIPREYKKDGETHVVSVLPQGAPTSGAVANLIAQQQLDEPLMAWLAAKYPGATYSRYSDNIYISHDQPLTREQVNRILAQLKRALKQCRWRMAPGKTRVARQTSPHVSQHVLGATVNEHINVPQKQYRRLRSMVYQIEQHGFDGVLALGRDDFTALDVPSGAALYTKMRGILVYWRTVNHDRIDPLYQRFQAAAACEEGIE